MHAIVKMIYIYIYALLFTISVRWYAGTPTTFLTPYTTSQIYPKRTPLRRVADRICPPPCAGLVWVNEGKMGTGKGKGTAKGKKEVLNEGMGGEAGRGMGGWLGAQKGGGWW